LNKRTKCEYGLLLTKLIKDNNITQSDFYTKLGIKKPYFYDIISGKINPPPPETQLKILEILHPKEEDRKRLLNIAAQTRNEMPADILLYLKSNINSIEEIRSRKNYKKFMEKIINEGSNKYVRTNNSK